MIYGKNISIQEYWQRVRAIQADLPPLVMLATKEDQFTGSSGGEVCEASSETAARLIFVGTHRIATAEEIQAWGERAERLREDIKQAEFERKNTMAVRLELPDGMALSRKPKNDKPEGDKK